MKKILSSLLCCSMLLVLCSCSTLEQPKDSDTLSIVATTYPVYCFATAVTEGVDGVTVSPLINQQISCLHDYTLTVNDMKLLEQADMIAMNGAGLEDFISDALESSAADVIDCSSGVELLTTSGHEGHDHDTEFDPHIWMDPLRAAQMVQNICDSLSSLDSAHAEEYQKNTQAAIEHLNDLYYTWSDIFHHLENPNLITFHNGFAYLADAFDLNILCSIEEEEGSEASAREIAEITSLIEEYHLPAIFVEVNGSDASAQAISRETGVQVYTLSMVMSGDESGIYPYLSALDKNMATIMEALEVTVS